MLKELPQEEPELDLRVQPDVLNQGKEERSNYRADGDDEERKLIRSGGGGWPHGSNYRADGDDEERKLIA